jgi:hypothetical protein
MIGVPLSMANHKMLLDVLEYVATAAHDPKAEFQFDISDPDSDGNRKITIKVESRIPATAARAILTDWEGKGSLRGYGSIKVK